MEVTEEIGQDTGDLAKSKTARKTKKTAPADPCLCCGDNCAKGQLAVKCVLCSLWAHKTCLKMPDGVYKQLDQQFKETGLAYWVCRPCQSFSQRVKHQFVESNKRHEETEKKVEVHNNRLNQQEKEIEEMKQAMRLMADKAEREAGQRDKRVYVEIREWATRRKNLILHGLREAPEEVRANRERMDWDMNACGDMFQAMGANTRRNDIRFCRRVGERGREPRPLVLGLTTEDMKEHVLAKARGLQGTSYDSVSVVPDLTKNQREQEADLKMDADERNKNLNEDDMKNNLRWIVVGRRGEKRLIKGVERDRENQGRRPGSSFYNNNQSVSSNVAGVEQPGAGAGGNSSSNSNGCGRGNSSNHTQPYGYNNHNSEGGNGNNNRYSRGNRFVPGPDGQDSNNGYRSTNGFGSNSGFGGGNEHGSNNGFGGGNGNRGNGFGYGGNGNGYGGNGNGYGSGSRAGLGNGHGNGLGNRGTNGGFAGNGNGHGNRNEFGSGTNSGGSNSTWYGNRGGSISDNSNGNQGANNNGNNIGYGNMLGSNGDRGGFGSNNRGGIGTNRGGACGFSYGNRLSMVDSNSRQQENCVEGAQDRLTENRMGQSSGESTDRERRSSKRDREGEDTAEEDQELEEDVMAPPSNKQRH